MQVRSSSRISSILSEIRYSRVDIAHCLAIYTLIESFSSYSQVDITQTYSVYIILK